MHGSECDGDAGKTTPVVLSVAANVVASVTLQLKAREAVPEPLGSCGGDALRCVGIGHRIAVHGPHSARSTCAVQPHSRSCLHMAAGPLRCMNLRVGAAGTAMMR